MPLQLNMQEMGVKRRIHRVSAHITAANAPTLSVRVRSVVPTDIMLGGIWIGPASFLGDGQNQANANATIRTALEAGIRDIDTAPSEWIALSCRIFVVASQMCRSRFCQCTSQVYRRRALAWSWPKPRYDSA